MCEGHPKRGFILVSDMIVQHAPGGGKGWGKEKQLQTEDGE